MKIKRLLPITCLFLFLSFSVLGQGMTNKTGFYMWDEATDDAVIEAAIAKGANSFRSRDITILSKQSAWNVFSKYGKQLDVMVAIPVYYTYTTTPVDLNEIADLINQNPFIRRLQIYPKLQPGLMNPSELNPCKDWLTGYAKEFDERIRKIDELVTDKSVEIVVAGQMGTPGCNDLTLIINTLYELQSKGRSVAWAVTDYPFYYGNQDASLPTLSGNIENILNNLAVHAPQGKPVLPLRIIETGWASGTKDVCSPKATQENQCTFANTAFTYSREGVKLYYFMLQDFADGWSDCEKHFGLYDVNGIAKCDYLSTNNNFYWVGGSGNWSDYSHHWATSSGGSIFHSREPGPEDNVFFDANSFTSEGQIVTIDRALVNVNEMTWEGVTHNPTINNSVPSTSNPEINVYGSLTFVSDMTVTLPITNWAFKTSGSGKVITTSGHSLYNIDFNSTGGWILADNLTVDNFISFWQGSLNTNGRSIHANAFISYTHPDYTRQLSLGASQINVNRWDVNSGNLTLIAGTSHITALNFNPVFVSANGLTYYDLTIKNNGTSINGSNTFRNVTVNSLSSITINGSNTFNGTLSFVTSGIEVNLKAGSVQTLNGTITVSSSCGNLPSIRSTVSGTTAGIQKSSGTISLNYIELKDIAASGGATFLANNSTDLGNNPGWTFTTPIAKTFYWIGGTGVWSDPDHWSLTSGGAPAGCIPSSIDNAIFDVASFTSAEQTVTLDLPNTNVNDMLWTGVSYNPTFNTSVPSASSPAVNLHGSLQFETDMTVNLPLTKWEFKASDAGNTIITNGHTLYNIEFNSTGGWKLMDDLSVENFISFWQGSLNTNGKSINATAFLSYYHEDLTRALTLGNSQINVTRWDVNSGNITFDAGTSHISTNNFNPVFTTASGLTYYDVTIKNSGVNFHGSNTFRNVTVNSSSTIIFNGSNTFNGGLAFTTKGVEVIFKAGSVQLFNGNVTVVSSCGNRPTIKSNLAGSTARFQKSSGTISLDYVELMDIEAAGGATFLANNSADLGNNPGWVFTNPTAKTFYWIGGTGVWSDVNHWSLTSGGTPADCIPSSIDNAIFDAASFTAPGQTVTLDLANTNVHNMFWEGVTYNPTLNNNVPSASYPVVNLYGDLKLVSGMTVNLPITKWEFKATDAGNTISTGGNILYNVEFNSTGGWILMDELTVDNFISLWQGSLNTNGNTINANAFISYTHPDYIRQLTLGTSFINVDRWDINSGNLTFNAGTSHVTTPSFNPTFTTASGLTYHDVTITGNSGKVYGNDLTFNNLTINSTNACEINGNKTINGNLILNSPGAIITLQSSITISLLGQIGSVRNCDNKMTIKSSQAGTRARISKSSGTVYLNTASLKDIEATGGAAFIANNCIDSGNNSGWMFQTENAVVNVTPEGPLDLCYGETVVLNTVYNSKHSYQWQEAGANLAGETYYNLNVTTTGVYKVIVTDSVGCNDISNSVVVIIDPEIFPIITLHGSILSSSILSGIQWYRDGLLIPGATNPNYLPDSPGSYTVVATVDGCTGESEPFDYVITANEFFDTATIRIFPNPATDYITIEMNGTLFSEYEVLITDVVGKPVIQDKFLSRKGQHKINIEDLPEGNYYLRMKNGNNEKMWHVVIGR